MQLNHGFKAISLCVTGNPGCKALRKRPKQDSRQQKDNFCISSSTFSTIHRHIVQQKSVVLASNKSIINS